MDEIDAFLEMVRGRNCPLSDKYSLVANRWVVEDHAARLLEDTKTTVLAERKNALIEKNSRLPDAHAERLVKADPEWREWLEDMVLARTRANKLKIAMEILDKREWENRSLEATKRAEMR